MNVILQPRDEMILCHLAAAGVADLQQIMRVAGFTSRTRAAQRLAQLSASNHVYSRQVPNGRLGRKSVYYTEKLRRKTTIGHVEHQLAISEVIIALRDGPPDVPKSVNRPNLRGYSGAAVPDACFDLMTNAGLRGCFLEVDLGSETTRVWRKKIQAYMQLALTGSFDRLTKASAFRVLIVTVSDPRAKNLLSVVREYTDRIFYLTTFEIIKREGFWTSIWQRPRSKELHSLM